MHPGEHDDDKLPPGLMRSILFLVSLHRQFQRRGRESVLRDRDAERAGGVQDGGEGGGSAEGGEV